MDIVVTGASGFIGRRLTMVLQQINDLNVIPVSRAKSNLPGAIVLENYKHLPSGDAIVHLAENSDRNSVNKLSRSAMPSSVSLMELIVNKGFENIVYTSSSVVYGDNGSKPYVVSQPVIGSDTYSKSKLACEKIVTSVSGGIVARLSNLYGPGMSSKNVISDILSQLPCKGSIMIQDVLPIRDFLWIDDAVELLSKMAVKGGRGIYNAGSGKGVSIRNLVELALQLSDCKHCDIEVTRPTRRYSWNVLDITHTTKEFDWAPKTKLVDGLKKMLILDNKAHSGAY